MHADLTLRILVTDPGKLHSAATADFLASSDNSTESQIDAVALFGPAHSPTVLPCVQQLFSHLPRDAGVDIVESRANFNDKKGPRLSQVLHLSTAHLPPHILRAACFERQIAPDIPVEIDGTSPHHAFFITRPVPMPDFCGNEPLHNILMMAQQLGAEQIRFSSDEPATTAFPIYGARAYLIRDLASGSDEDEEPLYWSSRDGWVDRASASIFTFEDTQTMLLPSIGSSPVWVDAADLTDQPVF